MVSQSIELLKLLETFDTKFATSERGFVSGLIKGHWTVDSGTGTFAVLNAHVCQDLLMAIGI